MTPVTEKELVEANAELQAKIHALAEVLVRKTEVRKQLRALRTVTERTEIEVAATIQAKKIMDHRDELGQWRSIEMDLMVELVATSRNIELMEQICHGDQGCVLHQAAGGHAQRGPAVPGGVRPVDAPAAVCRHRRNRPQLGCVRHVAIQKRAKKEGWTRDLAGKIAAKAEALVTKDAVTRLVTKNDLVTENELVDANAELQANVISAVVVLRASGSWHQF